MISTDKEDVHVFCFFRSVWRPSSGHAKLHTWWDASIWAGSSNGATISGWAAPGYEAPCHVSSRALLKQQSIHHIRFEVNTFLSPLCFFKPSCKQRAVKPVVVKTNIVCYNTWTFNVTPLLEHSQTTTYVSNSFVYIWLHVRIYFSHRFHSGS